MISNKGIKVLCYIVMVCALLVSCVLIILGIKGMIDENRFSAIWMAFGIALPLVASVSLYPIFALANIDENLILLNQKWDVIASKVLCNTKSEESATTEVLLENKINGSSEDIISIENSSKRTIQVDKLHDAIEFINQKYGINIDVDDSLDAIKFKISQISDNSSSANILIQKVSNACNIETIASAFILHKAAHT